MNHQGEYAWNAKNWELKILVMDVWISEDNSYHTSYEKEPIWTYAHFSSTCLLWVSAGCNKTFRFKKLAVFNAVQMKRPYLLTKILLLPIPLLSRFWKVHLFSNSSFFVSYVRRYLATTRNRPNVNNYFAIIAGEFLRSHIE